MIEEHTERPIKRVLALLKKVRRSDGGWVACCPAHGDAHQSLSIDDADGTVLLKCFAGCATEAVVGAMGLSMGDLFEKSSKPKPGKQILTLLELAEHKKLPVPFLEGLGWRDGQAFGSPCVEIPYVRRDGTTHRTRLRVGLVAKNGSRWGDGSGQIAYEPDGGDRARREGYVVIVEGETDTATLLHAGIPAIGIPGANAPHTLELEHVQGLLGVFIVREPDAGGETFVAGVTERLKELGYTGSVRPLSMPNGAKDPSALYLRDPAAFSDLVHGAMNEAAKPPPEALDHLWKTLGEWGSLASEPPPRRWLLDRPDDECNGARQIGVLPLGKVGMLVAAGGVGKTMALIQLAICVATGRKWLDHFGVANPGRVLLALAEEDEEEIWRRVYQAARAMRLTDGQIRMCEENIVALPLAGTVVNLIKHVDGETAETAILTALRKKLETGIEWRLLILDPLSRFAGFDSEKDNAAATTFISVVESLLRVPGRPSVLLAHHTNKASRQEGAEKGNAANARGASALIDGVRWAASLDPLNDGTVSFKVTKTNYSMGFDPIILSRDADHGGFLRKQSAAEASAVANRLTERRAKAFQTMRDLVIKTISERPGLKSANEVYDVVQGNRKAVLAAVKELKMEGFVTSTPEGLRLTERSGLDD